jgi:acyl carrier protein
MSIERVRSVFREVFEDKGLEVFPEMTARDVDTWDSFNHINLVVALEDAFDITFTTDEMAGMANVGGLVTILRSRGIEVVWESDAGSA